MATEASATTETKPTLKKPSRKAPVKKTTTVNKKDEAGPEKGKAADSPTIEKPKPKRTRTVKKKPAEADPV
jgi:hypothetical protein